MKAKSKKKKLKIQSKLQVQVQVFVQSDTIDKNQSSFRTVQDSSINTRLEGQMHAVKNTANTKAEQHD